MGTAEEQGEARLCMQCIYKVMPDGQQNLYGNKYFRDELFVIEQIYCSKSLCFNAFSHTSFFRFVEE